VFFLFFKGLFARVFAPFILQSGLEKKKVLTIDGMELIKNYFLCYFLILIILFDIKFISN
jgi:hypothetical protein